MSPTHRGIAGAGLALSMLLGLALSTAGCGTGAGSDPADGEVSSNSIAGTFEDILADRYDELFPDDRVVSVHIRMEDADWEAMQADIAAKEYYRADIEIGDELVPDVAVRTKGSSSLMQAARSETFRAGLKVDFNFFNSARTYQGIKKLCYSNGFSDPTLMKEFLGYEIMASAGIPTPRCCFVDLWVNDTHLGVYTQIEAVDATFASEHFADGNGNLYKPEIATGRLDWTEEDVEAQTAARSSATGGDSATAVPRVSTTTTTESYNVGGGDLEEIIERLGDDAGWIPGRLDTGEETSTSVRNPAGQAGGVFPGAAARRGVFNNASDYLVSVGLKTNEEKADHTHLYGLLEVLNSDPSEVSPDDLEAVLDVDEVLRYVAASVVLVHLDNYMGMGHNYYLYDDRGRFSFIPWDLNMSFGGFNSGLTEAQLLGFYIDEPTAASVDQYPLIGQLIDEPEYMEIYHTYLEELVEGPFSAERMTERIDEIAAVIRPYVENDENVSLVEFERGLTSDITSGSGPVGGRAWAVGGSFIGLVHFVEQRTASITAQLSGTRMACEGDGSGNGGIIGVGGPGGGPAPGFGPGGVAPGVAPRGNIQQGQKPVAPGGG